MSDSITAIQQAFGIVLKPFSWLYGLAMRIRAALYGRGLLPVWEPNALTISVGNIGWGGTGKTPIAGWLLNWSERKGLRAMLLSRGYKAKPVSYPYHVKPGALAEEAGDEPLMLARDHRKAYVVVDPNRTRGGKSGMKKFRPAVVVLDDGFQHMAVKRHLNLVLLRPEDLAEGWNKVIPAGSWREPLSALNRADAFMIKAGPQYFQKIKPLLKERLDKFRKPTFSFQVAPTNLRRVVDGETAQDLDKGNYLLVTGVGNPRLVKASAKLYFGYSPVKHMVYRDHHAYTKTDVLDMMATAKRHACTAIICTPKDGVKLGPMCTDLFWQFDLRVLFGPSTIADDTTFDTWWNRRFDAMNERIAEQKKNRKSAK